MIITIYYRKHYNIEYNIDYSEDLQKNSLGQRKYKKINVESFTNYR